jgi:hypothetical protein
VLSAAAATRHNEIGCNFTLLPAGALHMTPDQAFRLGSKRVRARMSNDDATNDVIGKELENANE